MKLDNSYIGTSVSAGTLRSEFLILSFAMFLQAHNKVGYNDVVGLYPELLKVDSIEDATELVDNTLDADEVSELIGELIDGINQVSPSGCYFGAHPGDGADFGFWPVELDDVEELGSEVAIDETGDIEDDDDDIVTIRLTKDELFALCNIVETEVAGFDDRHAAIYYLPNGAQVCLEGLWSKLSKSWPQKEGG